MCRASCARKRVKFRDPRLNRSREIPPEAIGGGIFDRSLNFDNCQPEATSDVEPIGVKVYVKVGDSRLNHYRDIRLPLFAANERRRQITTTPAYADHRIRSTKKFTSWWVGNTPKIRHQAVGDAIFDRFLRTSRNFEKFRAEVDDDVISGVAVIGQHEYPCKIL